MSGTVVNVNAVAISVTAKSITIDLAATMNANDAGTVGKNSATGHTHGWTKLGRVGIVTGVPSAGKLVLKARTIGLGANAASAGRYGQSITIGPMTVLQLKALDVGNGVKFVPTAGNADGSKLQNSPLPERGNCSTKSRLRSSRELAGGNCAASAGRARTGEIPDERVTCTC